MFIFSYETINQTKQEQNADEIFLSKFQSKLRSLQKRLQTKGIKNKLLITF